jgi:two-component system cell cycle response regulator DivK
MSKGKILVVEDNAMNRELVMDLLDVHGYDVQIAATGQEALDKVKSDKFDLVLMDIQLPGLDGFSVLERIKKDPKIKDVFIVALTAYAMKGDKERVMNAGFDGYISKPIDIKEFPKKVAEFLRTS